MSSAQEAHRKFLDEVSASALLLQTGCSLDPITILESLAHLLVPHFADWCIVDLLEGEELRRVTAVHIDPVQRKLGRKLVARYPPRQNGLHDPDRVLRNGRSELVEHFTEEMLDRVVRSENHVRLLKAISLHSYLSVPLRAGERSVGVLTLVHTNSGRHFDHTDVELAEELAARVGTAVENARGVDHRRQQLQALTRSEKSLREANAEVSTILGSITDAFFALDREWRFVYLNQQAEILLDRRAPELLGKNVWVEFPASRDSAFYSNYHLAMRTASKVVFEEFYPPLNRWFRVHAVPQETRLSVYFHDITLSKRYEQALLHGEARFRAAAEAVGDIIWTNDADGNMVGEQPQWSEFTGQTAAQLHGDGWAAALHPEDIADTLRSWRMAVAEKTTFLCEHRVRRNDGAYRLFSVCAVPVCNEDGSIREWVGVHTDITERRQQEEERLQLLERERHARQQTEAERERAESLAGQLREQRDELERANREQLRVNQELQSATAELQAQQDRQGSVTLALRVVNRAGARMLFMSELDQVMTQVMDALSSGFHARLGGVWLVGNNPQKLHRKAVLGLDAAPTRNLNEEVDVAFDASKLGWVARYRRPFVSSNLKGDLQFDQLWLAEQGVVSAGVFPLLVQERLLGVMAVFVTRALPLEAGEVLATLAALVSATLDILSRGPR
jgi:PAS domain S-box-containing protein